MIDTEAIITGILVGIIVAVVSAILNRRIIKSLDEKHSDNKRQRETYEALVDGVKSLLHDRLYKGLEKAYFRGVVGYNEFENLDHLMKPYERLGGNGTAARRFSKVDALPRVHDDELPRYEEEKKNEPEED